MSTYSAQVKWQCSNTEDYLAGRYSRGHEWHFDGGAMIAASSSPSVVPLPYSVEANVDPGEAFVAALSSCHMLFFLSFAAKKKWIIESYIDNAVGTMAKNPAGKMSMTQVILNPEIQFHADTQPSHEQIAALHHQAHEACFIANSVNTQITIQH